MEPQAVVALGASPSRRSLAGHVLRLGVYVCIFGVLCYLTFLYQGGFAGQLLLVYVSSLPVSIGITTVTAIARARQKLAAHHVVAGCLSAVLFCGLGGLWIAFPEQIIFALLGSVVLVWVTRYSPAAQFLGPPTLSDAAASAPLPEHRTARTWATFAAGLALLVAGVGLTGVAFIGQVERPGGLSITVGG